MTFPHSSEAERCSLSCFVLDPVPVRAICSTRGVTDAWFHLPAHARIFRHCCRLVDLRGGFDFMMLAQAMTDAGELEDIGGASYLQELWGATMPSAALVGQYLDILREKWIRRQVVQAAHHALQEAQKDGEDGVEVAAALHKAAGVLLQTRCNRPSLREELQSIIDEVREGRDDSGLVPMPVEGIHGRLKLYRGDLLIITAPTSCGKTALATQIALGMARQNCRVAIYPLEMAQRQVLKRAIAQMGGNNADFIRSLAKQNIGNPNPSDFARARVKEFMDTAAALASLDIHIRPDLQSWEQIRADIRMEHARKPFTFVLIDYLQLIQTSGKQERRQLALAEITQGAKLLAGELECVICMPSQVNAEGRTREAQDAENDASALIKIHPKEGAAESEPGKVTVWKQREGQRHLELPLRFNSDLTRFDYIP